MKLLGLSFDYHDAAAALIVDGEIIAAIQEERLSRVKHDPRFPRLAIEHCLVAGGIRPQHLDAVIYYEDPIRKFDRVVRGSFMRDRHWTSQTLRDWIAQGKFDVRERIATGVGGTPARVILCQHHLSHAASAFFCSPFEKATVVTIDGVGESETATISLGQGSRITKLSSIRIPHSIGLVYSAYTAFLGFEVNEGEYKVMGMAGFGRPTRVSDVRKTITVARSGFHVQRGFFDFDTTTESMVTDKFLRLFGPPREPDSPFAHSGSNDASAGVKAASQHYADIAASIQTVTEELVLSYVRNAVETTGVRDVVMAGGVAFNALANARIVRELGIDLYVHPAAGDAGSAIGAALWYHCIERNLPRPHALDSPYLGGSYDDASIALSLELGGLTSWQRHTRDDELIEAAAELLINGKIIGWFQGRSEWGPRALGARSILSRPYPRETQQEINEKIKFREHFRPFAPAVLAELAHEYFDMPPARGLSQPETYMLSVARVRRERAQRIPAVIHVDGTARLQLVWREQGTRFRALIEAFARNTGVPVVLNTSFNVRGEPIVETPTDAVRTFSWSGLDALVIGNYVVEKGPIM